MEYTYMHTENISIHSLRMEGDLPEPPSENSNNHKFQSTPSAWRETWSLIEDGAYREISIHSLRMEGDLRMQQLKNLLLISIHSLRMEGDPVAVCVHNHRTHFNPLPPHGGRPAAMRVPR